MIPLKSCLASFRDPDFQNFQRTLPLPPPATCIGMAGAALGLSAQDAQAYFPAGEWEIGVAGYSNGQFKDLWKYDDFKIGSILLREYLFDNYFLLVYGHEDAAKIKQLRQAFTSPVYALSCGNSDSICTVRVHDMKVIDQTTESGSMRACYAEGDLIDSSLQEAAKGTTSFSIRTTSRPVAQDLPVRFEYMKDGIRMLKERRHISYIQFATNLPIAVKGINYQDPYHEETIFIPVFPL
ncbi:MAG: CRISPR-associated protein Cas5 [Bacteroidota bacterium]